MDLVGCTKTREEIEKEEEEKEEKEKAAKIEKEANMTEEDKVKQTNRKQKVTEELVATEKNYCKTLDVVHNYWVIPVKAKANDKAYHLSHDNARCLTSNWETLAQMHTGLLGDITEKGKSVGEAFVKFSDYLKLYSVYLDGYSKILSTLQDLKSNKKFQLFLYLVLQNIEASGEKSMDLTSYLIQPVQRVPRYVMLLKEIRKYTFADTEEYDNLTKALKKVSASASSINENKRKMENMSKLLEISKLIGNIPKGFQLMIPHRKFIRQAKMTQIAAKKTLMSLRTSEREVFLFSDILLWTDKSKHYKGHVNLSAINIGPGDGNHSFEITTASTYLILKCPERAVWIDMLNTSITALKQVRLEKRLMKKKIFDMKQDTLKRSTLPRSPKKT